MTTPSNSPDRPDEGAPAADQPTGQTEPVQGEPTAAAPPSPPPSAAPPPPVPGMAPPPAMPYAGPFAPVMRARTPWVNPVRRPHIIAAAIVGALIFGGGGVLVGHAITDQGGQRDGVGRFVPGNPDGPGLRRGQFPPGQGVPQHRLPNGPGAPTPAPSGSATS